MTPLRHDGGMPEQLQQRAVVAPPAATTVQFAAAARALAAAARRFGLAAPTFRTPPRLVGLDRTVRRHANGGVVSVRLRGRPWAAVVADMVDGVVTVNRLDARRANRRAPTCGTRLPRTSGSTRRVRQCRCPVRRPDRRPVGWRDRYISPRAATITKPWPGGASSAAASRSGLDNIASGGMIRITT